jgi:hypothetical protein
METRSVRLMLLGIGALLFAIASGSTMGSFLPFAGLVLVLVGFFWKTRSS